jgi:tripartite-type tricarboxylate transporter receptor subunit TctC
MTNPLRRRSVLSAGAAFPLLLPSALRAQTILPDKDLTILVGFGRGGGTDTIARAIAYPIQQRVGRYVSVIDRSGPLGTSPGEALKKDSGDGSVVAFMASTTLVARLVTRDFPFDPLTDMTPIALVGTWPLALVVSPKLGVRTMDEYLTWVRGDSPGSRKLGSTASDAFIDAFSNMVSKATGIGFETKPYRGSQPMIDDLAEGRLPAAVSGLVSLLESHRGGRLRILMTTSPQRLAMSPQIPTAKEAGYPDLEDTEWFAFFASAKTPAPLVNEWNRQVRAVLADSELSAQLVQFGLTIQTSSPEEARARLEAHLKLWRERMQALGMTIYN